MKDRLQECWDGRGEEGMKEEHRSWEEGGRTRFEEQDEEKRQEGIRKRSQSVKTSPPLMKGRWQRCGHYGLPVTEGGERRSDVNTEPSRPLITPASDARDKQPRVIQTWPASDLQRGVKFSLSTPPANPGREGSVSVCGRRCAPTYRGAAHGHKVTCTPD